MSCGIYKITNMINQKSYIGQSIDIERRWRSHRNTYNWIKNYPLYLAFKKYGLNNFRFEILEECSFNELNNKEKYYISFYNSWKNGYNQTDGGQGTSNSMVKLTEEDIDNIYDLLINSDISQVMIAQEFKVGNDTISEINHGKTRVREGYNYPLRNNRKEKRFCIDCGCSIGSDSIRCLTCNSKLHRVVERPSRDELKNLIRTLSFTAISKQYGVSDNAIRKWCVSYNLPSKKNQIQQFNDKDWECV